MPNRPCKIKAVSAVGKRPLHQAALFVWTILSRKRTLYLLGELLCSFAALIDNTHQHIAIEMHTFMGGATRNIFNLNTRPRYGHCMERIPVHSFTLQWQLVHIVHQYLKCAMAPEKKTLNSYSLLLELKLLTYLVTHNLRMYARGM